MSLKRKTQSKSIDSQCKEINWELLTIQARYLGNGRWMENGITYICPEELVVNKLQAENINCCWCEGGTINLLVKASALEALSQFNSFGSRDDAIKRFLEAQLTILSNRKTEILESIRTISIQRLMDNIKEILDHPLIREFYPNVNKEFLNLIIENVDRNIIYNIADLFFENPYNYRSGWPDITLLKNNKISFIEVKTTDLLHESQLRFAAKIAKPLNLDCKVIQVVRAHEISH